MKSVVKKVFTLLLPAPGVLAAAHTYPCQGLSREEHQGLWDMPATGGTSYNSALVLFVK